MSLSERPVTDELVAEAHKREGNSEWTAAADLYLQALERLDLAKNLPEVARLTGLLARCRFKEAFLSKTREAFVQRMLLSEASYEKAASLYQGLELEPFSKRSKARALFTRFWTEPKSEERRSIIADCIPLAEEALRVYDKGSAKELAETRSDILLYSLEAMALAADWRLRLQLFENALSQGRAAIREFDSLRDDDGLFESLHLTLWLLAVEAEAVLELPQFQALGKEIREFQKQLIELSQRIGTPYAASIASEAAGNIAFDLDGDLEKARHLYEEGTLAAEKTGDSLVLGRLCFLVSNLAYWQALSKEYLDQKRGALEQGLEYASRAIENLEVSSNTSLLAVGCASAARCQIELAVQVETDPQEKRARLEKALSIASKGLLYETGTYGWKRVAHDLGKAKYFLAMVAPPGERRQLLGEILPIREETVRVTDLLFPHFWDRGVMRNYLALIKAELANLEEDPQARIRLLEGAASDMQQCLDYCAKWTAVPGFMVKVAEFSEGHADILFQLYRVTRQIETAESSIKAYSDAIEYLNKAGKAGSIPPIRWKIAGIYNALGNFELASETFQKTAKEYKLVASEIPGATSLFNELAVYMEAWADIAAARAHHDEEEYALAFEEYSKAAATLQGTHTWGYLSTLCKARSYLEKGEELSLQENHSDSIESISTALKTFEQARSDLEERLKKSSEDKEKVELKQWLKLASQREAFCPGRVELEEARALDKKGEKAASSRKYRSASETFKKLSIETDSTQERGELETLAEFCEAWARMKEAELKASPELYSEAARSFMEAKETTTRERFRFLALANASMCKALEAGTKFRLTRNTRLYSEIKKHLETAADYYQEAGLEKTGSWTRATQRMFDALVYMAEAETEKEPNKRTEFYHLAEKHLELAAKLYEEAGFPSKREEALHHLDRAREEKEILLATVQAIAEIPTVSGTSITSLSLTRGQPLGLERFEEANVIGNMSVPQRNLQVGSDFTFELEMANVGKATSTLVKLENVVPDGFEIEGEKNPYRIEDRHINLRGKRLEHLKMHEMKITLKPVRRGSFQLRPRILYVDDKGSYKSRDFPPVLLSVQELGIRGWLRGPGRQKAPKGPVPEPFRSEEPPLILSPLLAVPELPPEFHFETERARDVFQHLVKEFLKDYMSRRLYVEKAGWRSLMDLVRETKIPRSAVYGPRGRSGPVLQELERRGLIENRIFPEEPGRGGEITKVRVAYDNDVVKRIVDRTVMDSA